MSASFKGRKHDYSFLKEQFPIEKKWFFNFNIFVDLGYLGIKKEYVCKQLNIPHKKSKNRPLTTRQKEENKILSSRRVVIEHSIGGIKRYRILSDRLRTHHIDLYDKILGVCAGLWNFYIA